MSRRSRRAHRNGGGGSAVFTPASLPGLVHWYRAGDNMTLNGSDVSTWGDKITSGAEDFAQGTAADQPAYNSSDANFGLQPSVTFDSANTEFLATTTAATFKFMHDGTGGTMYVLFRPGTGTGNKTILDNCDASGANVGFFLRQDGTNGLFTFTVANGGANVFTFSSSAGTVANSTTHMICVAYAESASPTEYDIRLDKASVAAANSAAAPSSSNPLGALRMGRRITGTNYYNGTVVELIFYNQRHSTAQMQQVETYFSSRYAV